MNDPTVPSMQDAQLLLQDIVTKVASFTSASIDLGASFAPGELTTPSAAVVYVTAIDTTDGNETYLFTLQESADNFTFAPISAAVAASAPGVVMAKGFITRRYLRIALTVGGSTPSITYKAWLRP